MLINKSNFSDASNFIKRVWTLPENNTTEPSDRYLSILHLPGEKKHDGGFAQYARKVFTFDSFSSSFHTSYDTIRTMFRLK